MDFATVTALLGALAGLVLVLLAAWFLLRWMGKVTQGQRVSRYITILDRVAVGQDKWLVLVSVADKKMLIGMSAGTVVKLCDIEDEAGVLIPPGAETQSFSALLQGMLSKAGKGKGE